MCFILLLALFSIYILGGEILRGFAFAMIIGVFIGTYSSIFVASPILKYLKVSYKTLEKKELKNEGLKQNKIENIFCPLGFSLGGNHPQEIAVSIAAQLLYERDKLFGKTHTRNPVPESMCTS